MADQKFNIFSEPEFREYYRLNNISQTMPFTEAECFNMLADTTNDSKTSSGKSIICALASITILLLLSGIQLYRSVEVTPVSPEVNRTKKTPSILSKRPYFPRSNKQNLDITTNEIEILTLQNMIAKGKF